MVDCLQLAPHLGGVRTRYKTAAVEASSGFAGFPDFLQDVAKTSSQKVYSDQVSGTSNRFAESATCTACVSCCLHALTHVTWPLRVASDLCMPGNIPFITPNKAHVCFVGFCDVTVYLNDVERIVLCAMCHFTS